MTEELKRCLKSTGSSERGKHNRLRQPKITSKTQTEKDSQTSVCSSADKRCQLQKNDKLSKLSEKSSREPRPDYENMSEPALSSRGHLAHSVCGQSPHRCHASVGNICAQGVDWADSCQSKCPLFFSHGQLNLHWSKCCTRTCGACWRKTAWHLPQNKELRGFSMTHGMPR